MSPIAPALTGNRRPAEPPCDEVTDWGAWMAMVDFEDRLTSDWGCFGKDIEVGVVADSLWVPIRV
ncbi:hypothetical protein CRV24_005208 [Beauveria bassiana]|nr:hypothetical protein CRV24_005208 [Beauveria bassiana]KAH8709858.1 hypothetical protein HC256_009765 [Beauveria bassiana]